MTTNELIRELRASNQRETFTLRLTDEQAIALLEQWTTTELVRVKAERDGLKTSIGVMGDRMRLMDAELAALRQDRDLKREKLANCLSMLEELESCDWGDDGMPFTIDWDELDAAMKGGAS